VRDGVSLAARSEISMSILVVFKIQGSALYWRR
jgi:hypothetical protein